MKVALVHNFYQQPGGEDQVFEAEAAMLESHGHKVLRYTVHNSDINAKSKASLACTAIWSANQYSKLKKLFRGYRPDVVHVHNTLPLISPAVYYAAQATGAAVVQTVHNYRYACPNGLLFRNGQVCEDCVGKLVALPGVVHACYRGSRSATGVVAAMLAFHKLRGTYHEFVDRYIALTEFSRLKLVKMGLPEEKLVVKPNFIEPDPGMGDGGGNYALFVGRLTEEKGVRVLLKAWERIGTKLPLNVVGAGPLSSDFAHSGTPGVRYIGQRSRYEVFDLMRSAKFLIFPSLWYEVFPMTILEAFAAGTPVLASRLGNAAEVVEHGRTGLHFRPGDSEDLVVKIEGLLAHPESLRRMRAEARAEYEARYTSEWNYRQLRRIYEEAVNARSGATAIA